jgi:UDP-2,3-diacylglucosamine pyrophosphatase LpxH
MWNWWKDQTLGRAHPGVADADILIAGHYHHLNVKEQEGRAVFIAPSLVAVGEYFQDSYGVKTREGTLSMVIAPDGWGELHLIN